MKKINFMKQKQLFFPKMLFKFIFDNKFKGVYAINNKTSQCNRHKNSQAIYKSS